jgi:chemotaxis protein methyltransferase WspC
MGLDPASIGNGAIERAIRSRMGACRLAHVDDYWNRVSGSAKELQELIETIVVPETWFFRDKPAFSVLVRIAMEEWRPRHPNSVLRLLSIPCSTGEEPYSMVMALSDAGFNLEAMHVDAVDISTAALSQARRGVYGSNSFRGEDLSYRNRYFRATADGYELLKSVIDRVTFHQRNLLSSHFHSADNPYDIIFCRNLLIYFDRSAQEHAMKTLDSLLATPGFLFVGPAEAFLASSSGFRSMNQPMSFAFRKIEKRPVAPAFAPRRTAVKSLREQSRVRVRDHVSKNTCQPPVRTPASVPISELRSAQILADAGRLREAAECCEDYLRRHGPGSEAYYLLGLLRDSLGDQQSAAEYYRKALYLEPEHVQALIHLALFIEKQGDISASERLRERARRAEMHGTGEPL